MRDGSVCLLGLSVEAVNSRRCAIMQCALCSVQLRMVEFQDAMLWCLLRGAPFPHAGASVWLSCSKGRRARGMAAWRRCVAATSWRK